MKLKGNSLSFCVRDIAAGLVAEDEISQIIAGTRCPDEKTFRLVVNSYKEVYWDEFPDEAEEIALRLYADGKIDQPHLRGENHFLKNTWEDENGNKVDVYSRHTPRLTVNRYSLRMIARKIKEILGDKEFEFRNGSENVKIDSLNNRYKLYNIGGKELSLSFKNSGNIYFISQGATVEFKPDSISVFQKAPAGNPLEWHFTVTGSEKTYFKVVGVDKTKNSRLSVYASFSPYLSTTYEEGKWTTAKIELLEKGYGLCVFSNLYQASSFAASVRKPAYLEDVEIWECKINKEISVTVPRVSVGFVKNIYDMEMKLLQQSRFVVGTIMTDKVKLTKKVVTY